MSTVAIQVNDLSKEYHIGGPQKVYDRLGDQITDMLASPFRRAGKILRGQASGAAELDKQFWALKDVCFDIKRGEAVGIIGRNGAGKSTLLKILSRITEPTGGYADIYGRVGSLLEVGTGFHPELTGRENIYLNGAILGMKREEITRKFDEIVAFAEIDEFIDTPVKHYSSGMYVRLAFSVAAHLESEILLVDEVLAVGDMAFQRKCLGKMDDVTYQGRTVLFVSHNMALVQTLCERGVLLQSGRVTVDGTITEAVDGYLRTLEQVGSQDVATRTDRRGAGRVKLVKAEIFDGKDNLTTNLRTGDSARFVFHLSGLMAGLSCVFVIFDHLGRPITKFESDINGPEDVLDSELGPKFVCEFDKLLLVAGRYRVNVLIRGGGEWQDFVEAVTVFDVEQGQLDGRPIRPTQVNPVSIIVPHRWILPE